MMDITYGSNSAESRINLVRFLGSGNDCDAKGRHLSFLRFSSFGSRGNNCEVHCMFSLTAPKSEQLRRTILRSIIRCWLVAWNSSSKAKLGHLTINKIINKYSISLLKKEIPCECCLN